MNSNLSQLTAGGGPRAISDLALPERLQLLVLAPHPDDFDAIGVTLRFIWRQGHALDVAVFRTGSGVEDGYRPGLSLEGKAALREQEQRRSIRFFGLEEDRLRFLRLAADGEDQPLDCPENRAAIAALLEEKRPDIVFLPHYHDTNGGHRAMHALFRAAVAMSDRTPVGLLNRDPKTIAMRTDLYMPFGPQEAAWKAELLRCHDSQQQRNLRSRGHGFDARILDANRAAARDLGRGCEYAETFECESRREETVTARRSKGE